VSIGALTKTFPPELVDQVVRTTDTREVRRRLLPARLVVYFVLALWLFRGRNCGYGRVMSKLVDGPYHRRRGRQLLDGVLDPAGWVDAGQGRRWRPPNISSLSRARTRLGADPLPGVFCCGLRVVSIDGSTSDVPDTAENTAFFSRPSDGARAGAFPQVRWLAAAESGTGALIGASFGPYTVGEQTLARDLLPALGPDMVVLTDRNFLCHTLARDVLATGAHILWRASASFTLTPIEVLADGTYLAVLHPRRKADGPPITVRVIQYTVHTSPADGDGAGEEESSEVFALVTDLLDAEASPALELACAYPMRWQAETVIGHHKTDMGQGMPVLRSKDPEGVAQEMWALFAVYQAIHTLIGAAVDATGIPGGKLGTEDAYRLYSDAIVLDPFPGQWRPDDTGSLGLAAAQAARAQGLITRYEHAFGLDHALGALMLGPVIIGTNWYDSMFDVTNRGELVIEPGASVAGGNVYQAFGVNVRDRRVWCFQSWGPEWASAGRSGSASTPSAVCSMRTGT
jgi:transposase IS4-like protein/DDE family transposase